MPTDSVSAAASSSSTSTTCSLADELRAAVFADGAGNSKNSTASDRLLLRLPFGVHIGIDGPRPSTSSNFFQLADLGSPELIDPVNKYKDIYDDFPSLQLYRMPAFNDVSSREPASNDDDDDDDDDDGISTDREPASNDDGGVNPCRKPCCISDVDEDESRVTTTTSKTTTLRERSNNDRCSNVTMAEATATAAAADDKEKYVDELEREKVERRAGDGRERLGPSESPYHPYQDDSSGCVTSPPPSGDRKTSRGKDFFGKLTATGLTTTNTDSNVGKCQ